MAHRTNAPSLILVLSMAYTASIAPAEEIPLDLAKAEGTVHTRTVEPGKHIIRVTNTIPGVAYRQKVIRRRRVVPALAVPTGFADQIGLDTGDPCRDREQKLRGKLIQDHSEDSTAAVIARTRTESRDNRCKAIAARLEAATSMDIPVQVARGEMVTLTLSRPLKKGDHSGAESVWTVQLETQPRGEWLTTYGMAIIPDRDERFSLTPGSTAGEFIVTADSRRRGEMKYAPSVFFTWLPTSRSDESSVWGPTVGVGVGEGGFSAFVGGSVLINSNVQLAAGASTFRVSRLEGQYTTGDTIRTSLTEDQLHRETAWFGWFAALTLRFGSDPRERSEARSLVPADSASGEAGASGWQ